MIRRVAFSELVRGAALLWTHPCQHAAWNAPLIHRIPLRAHQV